MSALVTYGYHPVQAFPFVPMRISVTPERLSLATVTACAQTWFVNVAPPLTTTDPVGAVTSCTTDDETTAETLPTASRNCAQRVVAPSDAGSVTVCVVPNASHAPNVVPSVEMRWSATPERASLAVADSDTLDADAYVAPPFRTTAPDGGVVSSEMESDTVVALPTLSRTCTSTVCDPSPDARVQERDVANVSHADHDPPALRRRIASTPAIASLAESASVAPVV